MNMQPVVVSDDPLSFFLLNDASNDGSKDEECDLLAEELLNAVITEVEEGTSCCTSSAVAPVKTIEEDDKASTQAEVAHDVQTVTEEKREEDRVNGLAPGVEDGASRTVTNLDNGQSSTHPLEPSTIPRAMTTTNTRKAAPTAAGASSSSTTTATSTTFFNRGLESLKMAAASSTGVSSLLQKAASNLMSATSSSSQPSHVPTATYTGRAIPAEDSLHHASVDGGVGRATIATLLPSDPDNHNLMIHQQQQQLLSDPAIQAKLVTFAVGPLLQGERIIMFLPNVVNVASTDTAVTGLSSSASYTSTIKHSYPSLWAVCMTFYRFLFINYTMEGLEYLAMAPGSVVNTTNNENNIDRSNGDENEFTIKRAAKVAHGLDIAISRAGLTRQWQHHHATMSSPTRIHKKHVMQIPLSSIDRVEKGDLVYAGSSSTTGSSTSMNVGGQQQQTVVLYDKNGRWMRFTATNLGDAIRAHEALSTYAFPGKRNLGYLFAFESCREEVLEAAANTNNTTNPHSINATKRINNARFDPFQEFSRMGIVPQKQQEILQKNLPWSITMINSNYSLCSSYPSVLVVPHVASEETVGERGSRLIRQTASFRSEGRLPVLSWGCGNDAASLWRCSQPRVGLGSNRNASDEFYIKSIAETAGRYIKANTLTLPPAYTRLLTGAIDSDSDMLTFLHMSSPTANSASTQSGQQQSIPTLRILDLRPKASAMANRTQGYGYESTANYPHCQLSFYNIANIHGVRDSFQKLNALALSPTNSQDVQFSSMVESTGWLQMIRCILNASWQAATIVNFHRLPVILHCSHGWDRTSQVSALAQLMLDPFYRTLDGFAVLVEKEFCAFGHPFHMRSGHGETSAGDYSSGGSSQRAPVFLQFLDCVWQLINIFPSFFEFNGRYLLAVSDHIYSCRFGTLLCDNERERIAAGVYERTHSLWDWLDKYRPLFLSQRFNRVTKLLLPPLPCILRQVSLWTDYHLRYSPRAYLACIPNELVPFVHYSRFSCERQQDESTAYPEEFRSLLCASDEPDALLHKTLFELEICRNRCKEQESEIAQLKQKLAHMTSSSVAINDFEPK